MKKALKILGIIFLVITLFIGGAYLYLTDLGKNNILSTGPRSPKNEIPITYNIGWWDYQNDLIINEFNINIVESKLSLFNSKSLISYKIVGKINYSGKWKPNINLIHISERINKDTTQNYQIIIEITPIVNITKDEKLNGGIENFEIINEHIIQSVNWGENRIKFVCENKDTIIMLAQRK